MSYFRRIQNKKKILSRNIKIIIQYFKGLRDLMKKEYPLHIFLSCVKFLLWSINYLISKLKNYKKQFSNMVNLKGVRNVTDSTFHCYLRIMKFIWNEGRKKLQV